MKKIAMLTALFAVFLSAQAQNRWFTREGNIRFFSSTPIENIEAHNYQVNGLVDFSSGEMAFSLLMKGFHFEKALMEEHFNEKYVESDKFPKSTFEGKFSAKSPIDPGKAGEYPVTVSGKLTIHGVTQQVETQGLFKADGAGTVNGEAVFTVKPADYDIKIPSVVRQNIAETIEITVRMAYKPMQ